VRKHDLGGVFLPICDKCPIFGECPVYIGAGKGDPAEECPFLKLIKSQK
jgi:hypothetical protein